ncbi:hypothetical protein Gorai_014544, partial [Gossypium raimondii]|nr:hypothetical protein [Gossypium raimondii]
WNNPTRHNSIPTKLEGICLVLDQQTKAEFLWMPYADPRIQEYVSTKFLANHNIWNVKVPLIIFAIIEMHESNQVMRQFGCTLRIPPPPQELDDLHNTKLRERLKEDWPAFHKKHNNKSYLLLVSDRSRQRCCKRPRQGLISPRSRENFAGGTTSTPAPQEDPITVQPSALTTPYNYLTIVLQTPLASLFYRGESLSQSLTHTYDMYDRRLGSKRSQPRRKEMK